MSYGSVKILNTGLSHIKREVCYLLGLDLSHFNNNQNLIPPCCIPLKLERSVSHFSQHQKTQQSKMCPSVFQAQLFFCVFHLLEKLRIEQSIQNAGYLWGHALLLRTSEPTIFPMQSIQILPKHANISVTKATAYSLPLNTVFPPLSKSH